MQTTASIFQLVVASLEDSGLLGKSPPSPQYGKCQWVALLPRFDWVNNYKNTLREVNGWLNRAVFVSAFHRGHWAEKLVPCFEMQPQWTCFFGATQHSNYWGEPQNTKTREREGGSEREWERDQMTQWGERVHESTEEKESAGECNQDNTLFPAAAEPNHLHRTALLRIDHYSFMQLKEKDRILFSLND